METLYITDLDGTLLNRNAEVSDYTAHVINQLIDKGVRFSIATARTEVSAAKIMKDIRLNLPVILMNGVLVYDMHSHTYMKKEILDRSTVSIVLEQMQKCSQKGFMYGIKGDILTTYYENLDSRPMFDFYNERIEKYQKKFVMADDFFDVDDEIIYFTFLDTRDHITELYKGLSKSPEVGIAMYRDVYSTDLWYLECHSMHASKYNGVRFLKKQLGFGQVVSFGDNLNDLPMFRASDMCYAVANAKREVKEKATAVIKSNEDDGVAKWLWERFEKR